MMSERNVFSTTPTSTSRLSPSARPFTLSDRHETFDLLLDFSSPLSSSSSSSNFNLDKPYAYLNLDAQGHRHGYYAYHSDATAITAFPCVDDLSIEPSSRFAYYPSEELPVHTHLTLPTHQSSQISFISRSSSLGNGGHKSWGEGIAVGQQEREILQNKDQIRSIAGSLSSNHLLEQGTTFEGLKVGSGSSSVLHGEGRLVTGKDNQIRPQPQVKDKIHTESNIFSLANSEVNLQSRCMTKPLSISLDVSCSSRPEQSQNSDSAPLMALSHCDLVIYNDEGCFPYNGSYGVESLVSCAPDCFSLLAHNFKPPSAGSSPSTVGPVSLKNVASGSTSANSNMGSYSGYALLSMTDNGTVQNPLEKMACHDTVMTGTGEKRKIVEPVQNETKISSIMAKSKIQIACSSALEDLNLEQHGAKAGISNDKSSTDHDDSDVDSPCWKGTQSYNSPFEDSVPVNTEDSKDQFTSKVSASLKSEHLKNEKVTRNSLNPLAPVFIPGNSKQKVDNHLKECHGDNSIASEKIAALTVSSTSRNYISMDSVKAGKFPLLRINDIGIHCFNDVSDSRKEDGISYESHGSSMVNSSCSFQPYLKEEYFKSESQLVRCASIAGCMEVIADAPHNELDTAQDIAHNGSNSSVSFLATEIALNSHSTGVVSDFTERRQETSKSKPPKIDVKMIINTIQYLSELLLQNSSFSSLSEHDYDKLRNIINSLSAFISNQAGQMAVWPESHH